MLRTGSIHIPSRKISSREKLKWNTISKTLRLCKRETLTAILSILSKDSRNILHRNSANPFLKITGENSRDRNNARHLLKLPDMKDKNLRGKVNLRTALREMRTAATLLLLNRKDRGDKKSYTLLVIRYTTISFNLFLII